MASFSSSKHKEVADVSRGEVATRAPLGIPVVADPIKNQHQQQENAHMKVEKAPKAQTQPEKNLHKTQPHISK